MRNFIFALVLAMPAFAQADIIKCTFTEPYIISTYSMAQQNLTWVDQLSGETVSLNNVSFQIKGPAHFELWDVNRNVIQTMILNFKGADGKSDRVFPYDIQWNAKSLYGGCESNFLKAVKP